jgi:cell division protein FtsB
MVKQKRKENAAFKTRNDALATEIADLKQGLSAIEEYARMELGMIKRNEVFYQIVE